MKDLKQKLAEYITSTFLFGNSDNLRVDTSFLGNGIVDSTGMLEFISYIEREFQISIADSELVPENLDSIEKAAAFIEMKRSLHAPSNDLP